MVTELTSKYVDLQEYKKFSCLNLEKAVPDVKITPEEEEEGLSEAKLEQIKMQKRKKRRYANSFHNKDNLHVKEEDPAHPTLHFYD